MASWKAAVTLLMCVSLLLPARADAGLSAIDAYNVGRYQVACGKLELAQQAFTEAIQANPHYAQAYVARAEVNRELGEYALALDDLTFALQLRPRYADAFKARGMTYAAAGKFNEAIADFTRSVELEPSDAQTYHERSKAFAAKGFMAQSRADHEKALKLDPTIDRRELSRLAEQAKRQPQQSPAASSTHSDSQRSMTEPLAPQPKETGLACFQRGLSLATAGEQDRALVEFNQALALDPSLGEAYGERAKLRLAKGSPEQAIADYDQLLKAYPGLTAGYFDRGMAQLAAGKLSAACDDFEVVIRLNPKHMQARRQLAETFAARKQFDRARDCREQAIRLDASLAAWKPEWLEPAVQHPARADQATAKVQEPQSIPASQSPEPSAPAVTVAIHESSLTVAPATPVVFPATNTVEPKHNKLEFKPSVEPTDRKPVDVPAVKPLPMAVEPPAKLPPAKFENRPAEAVLVPPTVVTPPAKVALPTTTVPPASVSVPAPSAAFSRFAKVAPATPRLHAGEAENYLFRGQSYAKAGKTNEALQDFNLALKLNPYSAYVYHERSKLHAVRGETALAEADHREACRLDPRLQGVAIAPPHQQPAPKPVETVKTPVVPSAGTPASVPSTTLMVFKKNDFSPAEKLAVKAPEQPKPAATPVPPTNPTSHPVENVRTAMPASAPAVASLFESPPIKGSHIGFRAEPVDARPVQLSSNVQALPSEHVILNQNTAAQVEPSPVQQAVATSEVKVTTTPVVETPGKQAPQTDLDRVNALIAQEPGYAMHYVARGQLQLQANDAVSAIDDFTVAIRLQPEETQHLVVRGEAYLQTGRYAEAIADFDAAIARSPGLTAAYCGRGEAQLGRADFVSAVDDFSVAIRLDSQSVRAHQGRAQARFRQGNHAEAEQDRSTAVGIAPHSTLRIK